ncbi:hypothetical protein AYK26_01485 [Euryarchaeota archaeon SM23-78]|nr:MAG: hypothetical protein AYK26_01485 [Euryarchaeota archaeon SM23-78]MBW3000461.1 hypothetical protein [Candidatus Woesearchaeota archaeon]
MVIKKARNIIKGVFVKENKDYLAGETASSLTSLVTATASNLVLSELGIPKEINSVLTYITQCAAGLTAYIIAYTFVHKREEDPKGLDTRKHSLKLAKVGSKASIFGGIAKFSLHYGLLATNLVPSYLSAPIAYTLPGIFSSFYRHKKNYENGILCINNHTEKTKEQKQEKSTSLDELVC